MIARRHDNRFRIFSPSLGRYLSADPIGQLDALNIYAYSKFSPLRWVDPLGLASCTYSISSHTVVCVSDRGTVQIGPEGVFSGLGDCRDNPECADESGVGPIPPDDYEMVPSTKYGGSYLLKAGLATRLLYRLGYGRGEFYLHLGVRSFGCITVDHSLADDFNGVRSVLGDPSPDIMTVVP